MEELLGPLIWFGGTFLLVVVLGGVLLVAIASLRERR